MLPALASQVEPSLNIAPWTGTTLLARCPPATPSSAYSHLMTRIERKQWTPSSRPTATPSPRPPRPSRPGCRWGTPRPSSEQRHAQHQAHAAATETAQASEFEPFISIDDFTKGRPAHRRIVSAEHVEGAAKLIALMLDIGEPQPRQVFAGIKSAYDPATLVGRLTVMVANLARAR